MSARIVIGFAMAAAKRHLSAPACDDVQRAIAAVNEQFPAFLYGFSAELGLSRDEQYLRCTALLLQYTAIQLADDLADAECDYLEQANRVGPGAQWLLQHLWVESLLRCQIERETLRQATAALLCVGQGQQGEVRTLRWTLSASQQAAELLNGAQYEAYFSLLCAGTAHAARATQLGRQFGMALHVVGDALGGDARWRDLSASERADLSAFACANARAALPSGLAFLDGQLTRLVQQLELLQSVVRST